MTSRAGYGCGLHAHESQRYPTVMDSVTRNQFFQAVGSGDLEALQELLRTRPEVVECEDQRGWSSLMVAVSGDERRFGVVDLLLEHGAPLKHSDEDGWSVMHALSVGGGDETGPEWASRYVHRLKEAGADLEAVTAWGWTPLSAALMESDADLARALLKAGANPNVKFSPRAFPAFTRGWTLAHFCCVQEEGHVLLGLLLDSGVDTKQKTGEGESALELCERMLREPEADMSAEFLENVRSCASLLRAR